MKSEHVILGVLGLAAAVVGYQRHPSGRRYFEVWLAALSLL